jgi:6,7-dimethyl-8-ribityllumazine synthase
MATKYQNLSAYNAELMPDRETVAEQAYAIAVADWNPHITHAMLKGANDTLVMLGVKPENINVVHVPGTIELTYAANQLMSLYKYSAILVLGCVIQGETRHFDFVCQSIASGITELNLRPNSCPVVFGVLTTNTLQQAMDRADGKYGNKGIEAATTAVKMANIIW